MTSYSEPRILPAIYRGGALVDGSVRRNDVLEPAFLAGGVDQAPRVRWTLGGREIASTFRLMVPSTAADGAIVGYDAHDGSGRPVSGPLIAVQGDRPAASAEDVVTYADEPVLFHDEPTMFPGAEAPPAPGDLRSLYAALNGGAPVYRHGDDTYLGEAEGRIRDVSGWSVLSGAPTFDAQWITFPQSGSVQRIYHPLRTTIPAGTRVRVWWRQRGEGRLFLRLGGDVASALQGKEGYWAADVTLRSDRSRLDVQCYAKGGDVQVADLSVRPLEPSRSDYDIIVVAGGASMTGHASGSSPDPYFDMPHPLVDVVHGSDRPSHLAEAGAITAAISSIQHRDANDGVGPATAFARWYADNRLQTGRRLLVVPVAHVGGTLLDPNANDAASGSGAAWHPRNKLPEGKNLYRNAVGEANRALALGGENRLAALLWSHGESDFGAPQAALYREAFARHFAPDFRSSVSAPDLPIVVLGLNPEGGPGAEAMIAEQAKLDAASGHVDAVARCVHVAWNKTAWGSGTKPAPENDADRVHFGSDANRVRGVAAARAFATI